jgi:CheY-like chemotaxis protein
VESEEGKGSRFSFTIPLEEVNSEKGEPKIDSNKERFKTKFYWENKTVLVVEDDPVSQDFIKEILSPTNVNMIVKKNGGEALETFENTDDIKLILMDIQLPDMSGLDVTRKIREKNKKIPIIAQTAFAMAEDREKAIKAGCNDYVTKPLNSNRLLNLIDGFLKKEK